MQTITRQCAKITERELLKTPTDDLLAAYVIITEQNKLDLIILPIGVFVINKNDFQRLNKILLKSVLYN
jgi:hypothetical protein